MSRAMWYLNSDSSGYVNVDNGTYLVAEQVTTFWRISVHSLSNAANGRPLAGKYATRDDAVAAMRDLVHGFDPAAS